MLHVFPDRNTQRACQHIRLKPAVRVREENPFALGQCSARITSMTFSQPALRQRLNSDALYPAVLAGQPLQNLISTVGGTIVYNDNFQFDLGLSKQVSNRGLDARLLV